MPLNPLVNYDSSSSSDSAGVPLKLPSPKHCSRVKRFRGNKVQISCDGFGDSSSSSDECDKRPNTQSTKRSRLLDLLPEPKTSAVVYSPVKKTAANEHQPNKSSNLAKSPVILDESHVKSKRELAFVEGGGDTIEADLRRINESQSMFTRPTALTTTSSTKPTHRMTTTTKHKQKSQITYLAEMAKAEEIRRRDRFSNQDKLQDRRTKYGF